MLVQLKKEALNQYIDFAYELSLDLSKSCYPTYADGIKTKKNFIDIAKASFEKENDEIYLFYYENILEGWIHYYSIPEDRYFQCETFSIANHTEIAFCELLEHIQEKYAGYEFYFGCSIKNKEAIELLKKNNFEKIEESTVCLLNFDTYQTREENINIKKITKENYTDFKILHEAFDADMYWDSKHILEDIENWYIYVLYQKETPLAAIYFVDAKYLLEIYGIDFKDNQFDSQHMKDLMSKALNTGKALGSKHLYYFAEDKEITVLEELGFTIFDTYVCYSKII